VSATTTTFYNQATQQNMNRLFCAILILLSLSAAGCDSNPLDENGDIQLDYEMILMSVANGGERLASGLSASTPWRASADGRYVAFISSNEELGQTNGQLQVFWHDSETKETVMISVSETGQISPVLGAVGEDELAISPDGRHVVYGATDDPSDDFDSENPRQWDSGSGFGFSIFSWSADTRKNTRRNAQSLNGEDPKCRGEFAISRNAEDLLMPCQQSLLIARGQEPYEIVASGDSFVVSDMSSDGRYITFSNLTSSGPAPQVTRRDILNGTETIVSVLQSGQALLTWFGSLADDGSVAMSADPGQIFVYKDDQGYAEAVSSVGVNCGPGDIGP